MTAGSHIRREARRQPPDERNQKIYWYGAGTEILDESDTSGNFTNEYVFFGGRRIAIRSVSSGTIDYYEEDMLGSSRTLVQAGGTSPCFDADFLPFGYEKDVTTTCSQNYKFEGKERDTETGDDDFGARYYTFRLGRWLSADWSSVPAPVPYANLTNPQTLNLYAMVSDNPESFADLDGHGCTTGPGGIRCKPDVAPNGPDKPGEGSGAQKSGTGAPLSPSQLAAQVPPEVKAAIAASLKASDSPTTSLGPGKDDTKGGFHEEGGIAGTDSAGNAVPVPAVPGPVGDPRTQKGDAAHIDPTNSADPSLKNTLATVDLQWHVHPSGSITKGDFYSSSVSSFVQPPSPGDLRNANFRINIVVGAADKQVYFYNHQGLIGKPMKLKDFMRQ